MKEKVWILFVDVVTVVWLAAFVTEWFSSSTLAQSRCSLVTLWLLPVFVCDLIVLFRKEDDFKTFIKKRWFDVLLVIPYFRVFRIFRIVRMLKVLKILKLRRSLGLTRFAKKLKKTVKAITGSQC